jgi:hypothetical protein
VATPDGRQDPTLYCAAAGDLNHAAAPHPVSQLQCTEGGSMLQPSRNERPPLEIHYLDEPHQPSQVPASVLALETLGRMHPATAITLVLTIAGMTAGTVVAIVALVATVLAAVAAIVGTVAIAALGLAIAAIVLGGRAPTSR